jgi:hypothetical protein
VSATHLAKHNKCMSTNPASTSRNTGAEEPISRTYSSASAHSYRDEQEDLTLTSNKEEEEEEPEEEESEPEDAPTIPQTNPDETLQVEEPPEDKPAEELPDNEETDDEMAQPQQPVLPAPPANTAVITGAPVTSIKNLVSDPGFFSGKRTDFDDWWHSMRLYMKFNKISSADEKAIVIISHLRGGTTGLFAAIKADIILNGDDTIDWDQFSTELVRTFSDDTLQIQAEHDIEKAKQRDKNTADFLIEFHVLKEHSKTQD